MSIYIVTGAAGFIGWRVCELLLERHEFKAMVEAIWTVEKALGSISYKVTEREAAGFFGGHCLSWRIW